MLSIWLLCPILYWLSGVLMFWIEKQFPSLPWHMWKPCPAKHIIQPDPGLGSQRVCGCYATHRQAAEFGWQPLSGACWWTVIDLSTILSCHHNVHPGPLILYIFYTLGRISVSAFPKVKKNFNTQRHCGRYFFCHSKRWTGLIYCAYIYFFISQEFWNIHYINFQT